MPIRRSASQPTRQRMRQKHSRNEKDEVRERTTRNLINSGFSTLFLTNKVPFLSWVRMMKALAVGAFFRRLHQFERGN